jgi:hypothetical protein
MDLMIAYCGLTCDTCPVYLATIEKDPLKQRSMREEVAQMCSEHYHIRLAVQELTDCDGCRACGRLFSECEIRTCAIDRGLETCAVCEDYGCDRLLKHFEMDPESRSRLEAMRAGL